MRRIIELGLDWNAEHYFYGGSPETLERLTSELQAQYPTIRIKGATSPPFAPFDDEMVNDFVGKVETTQPDYVWVGLGTPKQDLLVAAASRHVKATSVAVGAAFDFLAGAKREAPRWMQGSGLEWLFRLFTEPRRLWRRYLVGNSRFVAYAVREQLRGKDLVLNDQHVDASGTPDPQDPVNAAA